MKKLLLFLMASVLFVAPSCMTNSSDVDVDLPDIGNPTVTLVPVDTDSDTGVFTSNGLESQTYNVVVDANMTLYTDADGTQLKSYVSSTDDFEVTYTRAAATITITPTSINYTEEDLVADITVTLNNNVGSETATIEVRQSHPDVGTISFESGEGLTTPSGSEIALSTVTIAQGTDGGDVTYDNVMVATPDAATGIYDGILFSSADGIVDFGQYYKKAANVTTGSDVWAGFALSQNYTKDSLSASNLEHFSAWATEEAGNSTFAIARYSNSYSGEYEAPVIYFNDTTTVTSVKIANTSMTYKYETNMFQDSVLYMDVVFTGYLGYTSVGSVSVEMISTDSTRVDDWTLVDLTTIGEMNSLTITLSSNDYSAMYGVNVPGFIAIDDLKYIKEWEYEE
ncbi:MAG: DUF4465 domain-containing protein [Rikenellaceae bacterium]